jgi:hypothetical protein
MTEAKADDDKAAVGRGGELGCLRAMEPRWSTVALLPGSTLRISKRDPEFLQASTVLSALIWYIGYTELYMYTDGGGTLTYTVPTVGGAGLYYLNFYADSDSRDCGWVTIRTILRITCENEDHPRHSLRSVLFRCCYCNRRG